MDALVIEDNSSLRLLWCQALEDRGYTVTEAVNAKEGHTKLATRHAYSLILSDLLLGDSSALGLLDYARIKNPDARIVLITGSTAYAHGELHSLAPAADWILRKPVPMEDFDAILDYLDRDIMCQLNRPNPVAAAARR